MFHSLLAIIVASLLPSFAIAQDRCMAEYQAEVGRIERDLARQVPTKGDKDGEIRWATKLHTALAAASKRSEECTRASKPTESPAAVEREQNCIALLSQRADEIAKRYGGGTLSRADQIARRGEEDRLIEERMACSTKVKR